MLPHTLQSANIELSSTGCSGAEATGLTLQKQQPLKAQVFNVRLQPVSSLWQPTTAANAAQGYSVPPCVQTTKYACPFAPALGLY